MIFDCSGNWLWAVDVFTVAAVGVNLWYALKTRRISKALAKELQIWQQTNQEATARTTARRNAIRNN